MRNFYNRKEDIVAEAIDGLLAASGGRLTRLADDHARVVLRADWDKSRVAIVSGGGSGHEPSHPGLVGQGLLTAAVCGEIFASPSVDAVLAAIVAVTGAAGCLLVVKNYTGDRLNFGLAAERAKSLGLRVEMVIVADDIALPGAARPRGVAGTIFIHKLAGYLSEAGHSLGEIAAAVEAAKAQLFTIGVARDTCSVPGSPKQERIAADEVEIGLGIHGEPGIELARLASSRELIANLTGRLRDRVRADRDYAVLFNNLGGLSGLECSVLIGDLMRGDLGDRIKLVAGPAAVMTALDMPGFSLSFLELTPGIERMLRAPVAPQAFPVFEPVLVTAAVPAPDLGVVERYAPSADAKVRQIVEIVLETCLAMESDINALDARVGDGDTGSTFAAAARAVRQQLDELPFGNGSEFMSSLSDILRRSMGGSSGVLLAILLARAAEAYRTGDGWVRSLRAGLDAMQKYGGARPGDRTMIDALDPALDALQAGASLSAVSLRARQGADATARMLRAGAGRSAYLDARSLDGVNDPGAEAVARLFEALAVR